MTRFHPNVPGKVKISEVIKTNTTTTRRLLCCRNIVRRLLLQPQHRKEDILSLEEILAEGVEEQGGGDQDGDQDGEAPDSLSSVPRLCRTRMKALQQAAYYSAEHGYLDLTMELREMGELRVPR